MVPVFENSFLKHKEHYFGGVILKIDFVPIGLGIVHIFALGVLQEEGCFEDKSLVKF